MNHSHRVCLAPMMDRTDRHFRYLLRLISPRTFLYTEMITAFALEYGAADDLLRFDPSEHPVAIQLGGSSPALLAAAAVRAERAGYDEVNLNVGCPSERVQAGAFGAALMLEPDLVADCVAEMQSRIRIPVTVKTRLGVDHHDDYEFLVAFTEKVMAAGCRTLMVHARKAWLKGLSPRQNREIPPLNYDRVHRLKRDYPDLEIILNGGLRTTEEVVHHLGDLDGVMLGRVAYDQPMLLHDVETALFDGSPTSDMRVVIEDYLTYMKAEVAAGVPLRRMARHLMGLAAGRPGARRWRRELSLLHDDARGLPLLQQQIDLLLSNEAVQKSERLHADSHSRYNGAESIP